MNHRLISLSTNEAVFDTPDGLRSIDFDAVVLALGGASWPQTGSDGEWVEILEKVGVKVSPLEPANCGWEVDWPLGLVSQVEGSPLKNVVASAEAQQAPGEIMLTKYGLEGGPLYQLGPALRKMSRPAITLDLKPSFTVPQLARKMESVRKNFLAESQYRWKLSDAMRLILESFHGPFESAEELAHHAKSCEISLTGPRPIEEAISSAGGVKWSGLGDDLMLRALPRVFVAGEMIDWEAPTGGYLLQGCFATGTLAGESAMRYLQGFTR